MSRNNSKSQIVIYHLLLTYVGFVVFDVALADEVVLALAGEVDVVLSGEVGLT